MFIDIYTIISIVASIISITAKQLRHPCYPCLTFETCSENSQHLLSLLYVIYWQQLLGVWSIYLDTSIQSKGMCSLVNSLREQWKKMKKKIGFGEVEPIVFNHWNGTSHYCSETKWEKKNHSKNWWQLLQHIILQPSQINNGLVSEGGSQ